MTPINGVIKSAITKFVKSNYPGFFLTITQCGGFSHKLYKLNNIIRPSGSALYDCVQLLRDKFLMTRNVNNGSNNILTIQFRLFQIMNKTYCLLTLQ